MKTFKLLDYTAHVFYNKEQHYPITVHLYDNCKNYKELHVGHYVTIDQLIFQTHLKMLEHLYHALNPVQTLLAVEEMRDVLHLWVEVLGED